ncbi:hypothetical protein ACJX0J_010092, partial [Zea mays]
MDEDDMHATSIFQLPFFNKAAKKKEWMKTICAAGTSQQILSTSKKCCAAIQKNRNNTNHTEFYTQGMTCDIHDFALFSVGKKASCDEPIWKQ